MSRRNLTTAYAHDLAEAANSIEKDPPSLIFLDNSLPDGQGVDFIPYLKTRYPETRIIMVTANDSVTDKKKALQQGADEFLGKPLSIAVINQTLDQLNT